MLPAPYLGCVARATSSPRRDRAAVTVALGFVVAILGLRYFSPVWWLSFVPFASEAVVLVLWKRWGLSAPQLLKLAVAAGIAAGAVAILTGIGNGLTDEPWAFPVEQSMLFHGINPYAVPHISLNPYTGSQTSGRLWELPLTIVLLIPNVPYGAQMLACWLVLVYILRRQSAGVLLGQPFIALLAANGFSDFLPLLLLSAVYVGLNGRRFRWAEILALGIKQFANVLVGLRCLWRKDWFGLYRAIAITAAWIVPFLLWDPKAFYCGAIVFDVPASCPVNPNLAGPHAFNPVSLNYWVWPIWTVALAWREVPLRIRRVVERYLSPDDLRDAPVSS